jgi:PhnB protein
VNAALRSGGDPVNGPAQAGGVLGHHVLMAAATKSQYEGSELRTVRPYLIVRDADAAIAFYGRVFEATELERHTTPAGGVGHAKLRIGDTIIEVGEHPSADGRIADAIPAVGLRHYVANVDETFARGIDAGATGDAPSERPPGTRAATLYDPFGLTWWLAAPIG